MLVFSSIGIDSYAEKHEIEVHKVGNFRFKLARNWLANKIGSLRNVPLGKLKRFGNVAGEHVVFVVVLGSNQVLKPIGKGFGISLKDFEVV